MQAKAAAAALIYLTFVTGLATAGAQRRGAQTPPARQTKGTASIAGTVTSEADGKPLTRVRVVLRSTAIPQSRVALSDARGAYRFDALPAGDYGVFASRTGFVLPHAAGGPARGVPVHINDGEARSADLALQRAGIIPGRLLDEDGTPLAGAEVEALSLRSAEGQPITPAASTRTDDRGEFRLAGLPAGQYFVVARDPAFTNVGDESGVLRYAATYHPGVFSATEAQPVTVMAGQESPQIEFKLQLVKPARVSGVIGTPERRPLLSGAVLLVSRDGPFNAPLPPEDVDFLPDGRFALRNVPPGRYQIRARAEIDPRQVMWFASFSVNVEGRDIDDISMSLTPGAWVSGRLDWQHKPAPQRSAPMMRVRSPFADGSGFGDSLTGQVGPDGAFHIRGVMAGSHYFTAEGLPATWTVTAVLSHGRDIMDHPTSMREGEQLRDIRVIVSRQTAELQGMVHDATGRPLPDTLVITIAPPPALVSVASPRFRTTRTDRGGRYRLGGLPAGEYRVAALSGVDEVVARRREWLGRVSADGTPVNVAAEGVRTLDLTALQAAALTPAVSR